MGRDRRKPQRLALDEMPPADRPASLGGDGYLTVPLNRLRFPARCCGCLAPTASLGPVRVQGWTHRLEFDIPVCVHCRKARQLSRRRPVQVRRYRPRQGTIDLRFRRTEYAVLLLEQLSAEGNAAAPSLSPGSP
jgi:hypothetical protein